MVGEFGEALLFDWGLAFLFSTASGHDNPASLKPGKEEDLKSATASCPAGTPAYMAPEQTDDNPDRLGPWTDVYLLGGVLYFILAGSPPRTGMNAMNAFILASTGELERPRQRAPDREIPEDLEELAMYAMAASPDNRPTALEFIAALQDHLSRAGQRHESADITRKVNKALLTSDGDYLTLSQGLSDLAQATGLWRANPQISVLRERILEQYVDAAISHGDLELARRMALQLQNEENRNNLEAEIDRRVRVLHRATRQHRLFLGLSLVLGMALLGFGIKYFVDQHRAQERLEEQHNLAVKARVQAERLSAFMLAELTPNLEALGHLDLLDLVAKEAMIYYSSLPQEENDLDVLNRRSLALRNVGRVLRDQGRLGDAEKAINKSLNVIAELVRQYPDDPELRGHLADRLFELGLLMQLTSDPNAALDAFNRAVLLYESLLEEDPGSSKLRYGLAQGLNGTAYELWARAEYDTALEMLSRAVELLENLVQERPSNIQYRRLLLEIYTRLGGVQRDRSALEKASDVTRKGIVLGESLVATDPTNIPNLTALSECWSSLGFTLWKAGDLQGALIAYERTLDTNRRLAERDPTNRVRLGNLGSSYSNVGEMKRDLGDSSGALQSLQTSIAILGPLVDENPDQAEWRYTLAVALLEIGTVHSIGGDDESAQTAWTRAAQVMETIALQRGDLYYLDTYVRALLLLGRVEEAKPIVDTLLAKDWKSPSFTELCRKNNLCSLAPAE